MDPLEARRIALEKRRGLQVAAQDMGIDKNYLSLLVDRFYDKVRADPELGPVFEGPLAGRWPEHMARMKSFWASVALRTGEYMGNPMEAHLKLANVLPGHFDIWLRLFQETLEETAPTPEAKDYFLTFALGIANRFKTVMFA